MKTCTVYGDMQADSAAEQYPTVPLCDACVAGDAHYNAGDRQIVSQQAYNPTFGDTCEWCGTTAAEEAAEA